MFHILFQYFCYTIFRSPSAYMYYYIVLQWSFCGTLQAKRLGYIYICDRKISKQNYILFSSIIIFKAPPSIDPPPMQQFIKFLLHTLHNILQMRILLYFSDLCNVSCWHCTQYRYIRIICNMCVCVILFVVLSHIVIWSTHAHCTTIVFNIIDLILYYVEMIYDCADAIRNASGIKFEWIPFAVYLCIYPNL